MNSLTRVTAVAALAALAALALALAGGAAERRSSPSATPAASGELAVVRSGDLFTVRSDGTALTRLARTRHAESGPAWSPDGTRLAFVRELAGNAELYVADANGQHATRITRTPRAREYSPAWSPDGRWIAFASDRTGEFELYVIRPDGTAARRVTTNARRGYGSHVPTWSPDGRLLAFSSSARTPENAEIYVVRPNGTALRRLTRTKGDAETLGDDGWPHFSPDGRRIVFSSNRTSDGDVWVMNANGSGQRRLVGLRGRDDWHPRFSPDGMLIAFHSLDARGRGAIYVIGADGKGLRRLGAAATDPAWRPTG